MNTPFTRRLGLALLSLHLLASPAVAQTSGPTCGRQVEDGLRHVRACYAAAKARLAADKTTPVEGPCADDATAPKPDWITASRTERTAHGLRVLITLKDGALAHFDGSQVKESAAPASMQRADGCFGGWFTPETCCYRGYCCKWVGKGSPNCG